MFFFLDKNLEDLPRYHQELKLIKGSCPEKSMILPSVEKFGLIVNG